MTKLKVLATAAVSALALTVPSVSAMAAGKTIAVSWKTFQEERWKTDEAAIKAVVEAAGDKLRLDRRAGSPPRSRPPTSKA